MVNLKGSVQGGVGDFKKRITKYPGVFKEVTGENLFHGTINVKVEKAIPVKEHFRIRGVEIDEPEQDLLFEICRINGNWAYRIRPYILKTGGGGHGDDLLEIACSVELTRLKHGSLVEVALFRTNPG